MSLARIGDLSSFAKFVSLSALGGFTTYWLMNPRQKQNVGAKNVVVATGCDSGLGYSIAVHCHNNLNMSVVACVHELNGKGANKLKTLFSDSKRFHIVELEVTKNESVESVRKFVQDLLDKNKELSKLQQFLNFRFDSNKFIFTDLTALVNNCGVMCFGETEWQTNEIIDNQIGVNLAGSIRMTKGFLPLIRCHKSRIINVTSHCGLRSLPGLPIYCATKAGLVAFTESLRLDMNKYGVDVVNFVPGSFVSISNIASNQPKLAAEMLASFNEEQVNFYADYFDRYNKHLECISGEKELLMVDQRIIETFQEALLDLPPKKRYICEPLRYKFYHALFKITPKPITDILLHKFVMMPSYDPTKSTTNL